MSLPMRHIWPNDLPRAWQMSAQLVSAVASLLLIVPMFYLGRELFERRIAFWACVLFQCLPTSGKIMGDGLSDTLFLLFACSALWLACRALRLHSWPSFALTGLAGGLAYLTRPEGALIIAAAGTVLAAMQLRRTWRQAWSKVLLQGGALTAASLAVMTPYMIVIRGLTVKNTPNLMMNRQRPDADWENRLRPQPPADNRRSQADAPSTKLFAVWYSSDRSVQELLSSVSDISELPHLRPPSRSLWALKAFAIEIGKGFFYIVWLPALLGLWWRRERFLAVPGVWVGFLVCSALTALLYRMAEKMGYLSDRHLLLVILCGSYWAVAGTILLGEKFALGAARLWPGRPWTDGRIWSLGFLLLLAILPLPRTLSRLHAERAGFRSLGHWLSRYTEPGDFIEDPYCWAYYYAGRVFVEGCSGLPAHHPGCFYVVMEKSSNRHPHLVSLRAAVEHTLKKRDAEIIHTENVHRGREEVALEVWKVPGPYQWMPLPGLPAQK
jgi:hypothetical protein